MAPHCRGDRFADDVGRLFLGEVADAGQLPPLVGARHVAARAVGGGAQHARIQLAVQLQRGRGDRRGHPPGVAQAVGAELGAGRPAVVLHRAVRGLRDAGGRPVPVDGVGEVAGAHPLRTGPALHQVGDRIVVGTGQPALGEPRQLEREHVARRTPLRRVGHAGPEPPRVRHRQHDQPPHAARVQRRRRPAEQPAPVVPDDDRLPLAEGPYQRSDVGRQVRQVVAAGRLVAGAVPAQVGGDDAEAGGGQGDQLGPPRPPELREPVQQQDQRALAGLGDVQPDAVGGDVAVVPGTREQDAGRVGSAVRGNGHHRRRDQTW